MSELRIGIDVGGTFTDIVGLADGRLIRRKVRSTPNDFSIAFLEGLRLLLSDWNLSGDKITELIHGTTVVTNAIIEKKGAKTGLVTTSGFRDVLEIGRLRTPRMYDLTWRKPAPLVPRELRREVNERLTRDGSIYRNLDEQSVREAARILKGKKVESIAICLINSFANGRHEQIVADILRKEIPGISLSISHEVLPEMREYERTSTTVINAYVRPLVEGYLNTLEQNLEDLKIGVPLQVMQSSGGVMSASRSRERPIFMVESGPAAGVMGSLHLGRRLDHGEIISFDMGGTTAKVATLQNGEAEHASEYEVGGELHMGHHLLRGDGYMLRVPSIGVAEVGAGGGSIIAMDEGGVLQVGPRSAGADPGPACYGLGGQDPTITDANVALGYLNPTQLVGGDLPLHLDAAYRTIEEKVAKPLGIGTTEAAYGAYLVANSRMIRAVRAVTSEKGRNPADFTMYAFGGGGPAHAVEMARLLNIKRVIVPPVPGLFSSLGLLFADVEHQYVQTTWRNAPQDIDCTQMNRLMKEMESEATTTLEREGFPRDRVAFTWQADMRYQGQQYELPIRLSSNKLSPEKVTSLVEDFHQEHNRTFGYRSDEQVQLVNIRLTARGIPSQPRVPSKLASEGLSITHHSRKAYFGPVRGWVDTPVINREDLDVNPREGPLIIEEYDATTIVPPESNASRDDWGNIVITLTGGQI